MENLNSDTKTETYVSHKKAVEYYGMPEKTFYNYSRGLAAGAKMATIPTRKTETGETIYLICPILREEIKAAIINDYFDKYSGNMKVILEYLQYKKYLYEYRQEGHEIYKMIPYITYAIDTTLLIKIYGFFDKDYGLPLNGFLRLLKGSQFDKDGKISSLESELENFEKDNAIIKNSIRNLRNATAHVNPNTKDASKSITVEDVESVLEWIKKFINELHKLCGKSSMGYYYDTKHIFMDVLDVLKRRRAGTDKIH
ncbi:MAG: DUF4145 domain-containing protein [Defluviitaleaceae bacterium]|nr:DUF4145 domain-containing protein [Defluviitaleaceae bacterium]